MVEQRFNPVAHIKREYIIWITIVAMLMIQENQIILFKEKGWWECENPCK